MNKNEGENISVIPGDRAMPTMSTGMEAEEETEHHLMRALATETVRTFLLYYGETGIFAK